MTIKIRPTQLTTKKTNAYYYNTDNSKTKHSYLSPDEYNEWDLSKPKIIRNNEVWVEYRDREDNWGYCVNTNKNDKF